MRAGNSCSQSRSSRREVNRNFALLPRAARRKSASSFCSAALQSEGAAAEVLAYDLVGPAFTSFSLYVPLQAREAANHPIEVSALLDEAAECTAHVEYRVDATSFCAVTAATDSAGGTTFSLNVRNFPIADMAELVAELLGTPFTYEPSIGRCRVSGSPSYGESTTPGALLLQLGLSYRKMPDGGVQACARIGERMQPVGPNFGTYVNVDNAGNFQVHAYNADSIGLLDDLFGKAGEGYVVDEPLRAVGVQCNTGNALPFEAVLNLLCNTAGYSWELVDDTYHVRRRKPGEPPATTDTDAALGAPPGRAVPAPQVGPAPIAEQQVQVIRDSVAPAPR